MSVTIGHKITTYKRKHQSSNVYKVDNSIQISSKTIGYIGYFNADQSMTIFDIED